MNKRSTGNWANCVRKKELYWYISDMIELKLHEKRVPKLTALVMK